MSDRNKETSKGKHTYEGCFDENSPRPPVPGEERAHCSSSYAQQIEWAQYKLSSPTPLKGYYTNETYSPMGYEPEKRCKSSSSSRHEKQSTSASYDSASLPACLRWASSLEQLLDDLDGVELFQKYLKSEGQKEHGDALNFWFACEGLQKQKEVELIKQIVKRIYSVYFKKCAFPISDDLRKRVSKEVKRVTSSSTFESPVTLFDETQAQVEKLISNTTYPNFLKSEMYLNYIQSVLQNPVVCSEEASTDTSSSSSCVSAKDLPPHLAVSVGLPTLHEDREFVSSYSAPLSHAPGTGCLSTGYHTPNVGGSIRLTKDMLLATESRRLDVRSKPEAYADKFLYRGVINYSVYNSYNPVSRQGSELQSLSSHSDARTESDNMSLTDNSVDGKSLYRASRRQMSVLAKQAQEQAALNKRTNMDQLIPRTQRREEKKYDITDPDTFNLFIKKLERVKREREQGPQDLLSKKLKECDSMNSLDDKEQLNSSRSTELANAIKEKLQLEDDNDQDILDEHVSRVFSDGSPGFASPKPYVSSKNRWHSDSYNRLRRKDKDGFSTFSSDSGNVHDFWDSSEHRSTMVKSKSMEDRDKFTRGTSSRRSSSKKTVDLTLSDSGVSVVSDSHSITHGAKDFGVLAWMKKSDRGEREVGYIHSEITGKHNRHRKTYNGSRSSSIERNSTSSNLEPAQPFVADPNMPPLPLPNTSIQLEEARRRLEDDVRSSAQFKQKFSSKYVPESTRSGQSTLHKYSRGKSISDDFTAVVFSFWDEELPYLIKIPGRQITLKQLKENLPKKGNYRYFFKTECEELDNQIIQEEVRNDSEIVPLFEGKIMAQAKPVD